MIGSGLLVLNAIQPIGLFAKLIGDTQLFWANPKCSPSS